MSIILGRGEDAKKVIAGENIDFNKAFIRLKAGESRRVRVLTKYDYVAYKAHGHYNKGIFTQPCIKNTGERCLLCEAANYDGDLVKRVKNYKGEEVSEWSPMYARTRVLFAFVDLDDDEIKVFDATKSQADGLIATIEEYADDLDSIAFTLKRTGERADTTYTLSPIMPKKMKEVQEVFDKWDGHTVSDDLFIKALQPRTTMEQAKELQQAGFPVKEVFGIEVNDEDAGVPIDEDDPVAEF